MRALVIGGGSCVWHDVEEIEAALGRPWDGLVLAVNEAGIHWKGALDAWVSLHPEKFKAEKWVAKRHELGNPSGFETWGGAWRTERDDLKAGLVDRVHRVTLVGSSGMHAVEIALEHYGADRIALAGIPMDARPNHFRGGAFEAAFFHLAAWRNSKDRFRGKVASPSGETRKLFGPVTREFLDV